MILTNDLSRIITTITIKRRYTILFNFNLHFELFYNNNKS